MKVLLATPYNDGAGGINQWAKHIVSYYHSNPSDIDIDILEMNDPQKANQTLSSNSLFSRISHGIRTYSRVIRKLYNLTKRDKYDILHIATSASISLIKDFAMIKIAKKYGKKSVLHFHFGRIPQLARKNNWEWKMLTKVVKMADVAITIDQASYDTLINCGYKNISLLPNPLAPSVEQLINKHSHICRTPRKVVFVGNCIKTKGVYELVQACKDIDNISLSITGPISDDIRLDLVNIADRKPWLQINGQQPLENVIKEMLSCNIFALPTYTEGFPNVIIESMACGCPIITTPVGAIPEMLNIGSSIQCGICVAPQQTDELKTALTHLLDNTPLAEEYGNRARQRVSQQYKMDVIWRELTQIWKSA